MFKKSFCEINFLTNLKPNSSSSGFLSNPPPHNPRTEAEKPRTGSRNPTTGTRQPKTETELETVHQGRADDHRRGGALGVRALRGGVLQGGSRPPVRPTSDRYQKPGKSGFIPETWQKSTDAYQKTLKSTNSCQKPGKSRRIHTRNPGCQRVRARKRDSERCARGASFVEECCKEALDRRCVQRFLAGLLSS